MTSDPVHDVAHDIAAACRLAGTFTPRPGQAASPDPGAGPDAARDA